MVRDKKTTPTEGPQPTEDWLKSFRITRVYGSYASRAARSAVMLPILNLGRSGHKYNESSAFSALRRCWHARVLALKEAGWKALRSDKDVGFMRNCPPFSVETKTQALPCNKTAVCPFCYAKYWVIRPFRAAEKVLFGCVGKPKTVPKPIRPDLRVVWFRSERGILANAVSGAQILWSFANLPHHVAAAYDHVRKTQRDVFDLFGAEAGCINNHLLPDLKVGRMLRVRGGVLLIPAATLESAPVSGYLKSFADAGGKFGILPPSRKSLYAAFCRGMSYSKEHMFGDPAWEAAVLNCAPPRGFRLGATYGSMRASKEDSEDAS